MSNTYQISISSNARTKEGGKTADVVQPIHANSAQAIRLLAQSGDTYTLTHQSTGKAPQQIHTKRRGNDLLIQIDDYRPDDSADLILENYFEQAPGPLTGVAEDDISYRFIPNTALPQHQIGELIDGASITQVLGGSPFFVAAPLLGVAGVGGAVAAASMPPASMTPVKV